MSVRVMSWVWAHSRAQPVHRLVLLAIADCANDTGAEAYPSTSSLARKTGLSERGVRGAVAKLVQIGELMVEYKTGPRGCNRYRVPMRDPAPGAGNPEQGAGSDETRHVVHSAPCAGSTRHTVPGTRHETTGDPAHGAPEPSENRPPTEPSLEPSSSAKPPKRRKQSPDRADVERLCVHLADSIEANGSKRPTVTEAWRDAARLLLDKDGRTVEQVVRAIDWCQADEFWRSNILSMPKLRAKYDTLRLQATRNRGSPNGRASTTDARVAAAMALAEKLDTKEIST